MTDVDRPFRALAGSDGPVSPDPDFTARLRARLQRELLRAGQAHPATEPVGGTAMSQLTPYLVVRDARAALAWYTDALGARVVGDPYLMDDGRIGHAELVVGGAAFYLADEYPELGLVAPEEGRVSMSLHVTVPDADAAVTRAADAGATVERPPADSPYGRTGVVVDPQGHRWMLQAGPPAAAGPRPPLRPGDAVYLTLDVPDGRRALDFYGAVLGWSAVPGRVPDGWQVEGPTPMVGIGGGAAEPGTVPMYVVDDIEVAVAAVRTAGGEAGDVEQQAYGLAALCRDDQGLPFWLGQLS
ncbi:MAG: Glyoxalase family protein [uncultured Blastococcus sp.]|uniref:Glyoxalase family protein n=1 Tax=uncultured Blastococcus sp. TaxID=217144 RepID=A0A6J4IHW2_9ACTN|nr:MAG: Glyoxalase family protein [uncultured Blastococcus sp.]